MSEIENNELLIDGPDGQLQLLQTVVKNNFNTESTLNATAVICHPHPLYGGSMNNKVVHIINKAFNLVGVNTLRFNFRGVEKSQGKHANGVGEVDDLLAVLSWLKQHNDNTRLYLAGFSFGSFIAAQVATHEKSPINIEKLLLVAPPVSLYDFDDIKLKIPCLVIQGGNDTVVDPEQVRLWSTNQGSNVELEWNDDAEHFFHGKLNFIRDVIARHWFSNGID